MAYNADTLKNAPQGWADFWNVAKDQVYEVLSTPEGVNRAFAKLDQLKPNIQWWEAGAQPMQYLAANDVVMTTAFNGRIFAAQQSGAHVQPVWGGSIHAIDYWAIPRGSKNKALAEDFIASTLKPQAQKEHSTRLGYGSVNLQTTPLLDPKLAAQLNTAPQNITQSLPFNNAFWVDHGEELETRFNAWVARGS